MVRECHRCKYFCSGSVECLSCVCDPDKYDLSMSKTHAETPEGYMEKLQARKPQSENMETVLSGYSKTDMYDLFLKFILAISDMTDIQSAIFRRLVKGMKPKIISEQISNEFNKTISIQRVCQLKNDIRHMLSDISPEFENLWKDRR